MVHDFLADSDFFIALYSLSDTNHTHAVRILSSLAEFSSLQLFTSVFVYSETATILSQRVAQKTAHHFMEDITKQGVILMYPDEIILKAAQDCFKKQRSKNVSFVDAINITLMREYTFSGLLSFDQDYVKNGITLVNLKS